MRWRRWGTTTVVVALGLLPALLLARDFASGALTEPVDEITDRTGWWTIFLVCTTLAVSPLRRFTGWNGLIRHRRTVGLLAFGYASAHFLTYLVLDQFFALGYIIEDIAERPYITVGFTAWLLMIPLAWTSTRGWVQRLGKRWTRLHQLIYVTAALGVLHFLWQVKADIREPAIFGLVVVGLLATRLVPRRRRAATRRGRSPA